jgi:phosphoglycerate dehydrogenase-like enzyme
MEFSMTKARCAVLDDYQNVALKMADWSAIADRVDIHPFHEHLDGEDALVAAIGGCEILVVMRERTPLPASLLARLPRLQLIVTTGRHNASIDLRAAAARGVVVCGTGSGPEPPAELTWALILALSRSLVAEAGAFRSGGPWQQSVGRDLYGSRLGILGLGRIGSRVAAVGRAFGMHVAAWSQHLTAERAGAAGADLAASKEALLEGSDFVTIHLVLSERTRHLIGAPELKRMRPTACLINTSRAQIVDQAALLEALERGWIAGAGLDVFETEPLPLDHPFRRLPTVLGTPHLGYVSQSNYRTYYREVVEDIAAFLEGKPIRVLA